jgi:hypothetical protein
MDERFWLDTKLWFQHNKNGNTYSLVGEMTRKRLEKNVDFSDVKYRGLASQVLLRPAFNQNWY